MDPCSIYLYCLARAGLPSNLAIEGLAGGGPVESLETDGLAAVISKIPIQEFEQAVEEGLGQNLEWVAPRACRHEFVVESVMRISPVLPVRFGTIFSREDVLEAFMKDRRKTIVEFLDRIASKREWSIKAFMDLDAASEWIISSDSAMRDEWLRLPESPGTRYFLEKRLQAEARRRAIHSGGAVAQEIHRALSSAMDEVVRLPLRSDSKSCKEMVLNVAVLGPCSIVESMEGLASTLLARFVEQGISLECSGPWPPFHFCPSFDQTAS